MICCYTAVAFLLFKIEPKNLNMSLSLFNQIIKQTQRLKYDLSKYSAQIMSKLAAIKRIIKEKKLKNLETIFDDWVKKDLYTHYPQAINWKS